MNRVHSAIAIVAASLCFVAGAACKAEAAGAPYWYNLHRTVHVRIQNDQKQHHIGPQYFIPCNGDACNPPYQNPFALQTPNNDPYCADCAEEDQYVNHSVYLPGSFNPFPNDPELQCIQAGFSGYDYTTDLCYSSGSGFSPPWNTKWEPMQTVNEWGVCALPGSDIAYSYTNQIYTFTCGVPNPGQPLPGNNRGTVPQYYHDNWAWNVDYIRDLPPLQNGRAEATGSTYVFTSPTFTAQFDLANKNNGGTHLATYVQVYVCEVADQKVQPGQTMGCTIGTGGFLGAGLVEGDNQN